MKILILIIKYNLSLKNKVLSTLLNFIIFFNNYFKAMHYFSLIYYKIHWYSKDNNAKYSSKIRKFFNFKFGWMDSDVFHLISYHNYFYILYCIPHIVDFRCKILKLKLIIKILHHSSKNKRLELVDVKIKS